MIDMDVVALSRLQFALTALIHFIFVPLTLGLSILIAVMESVYVMTRRAIWRKMTQFWGLLFGINFALGAATGLTMEFQFGTNWSYYAHYVGDVFGAPLAIEALMAFFLEATFIGLFFFGWDRLSRVGHLTVTWLMALGTNFSALWILIANGWMQHPVGSHFNVDTMRMELGSFYEVVFNTTAQAKFVHTVSAGYVTGAVFVLAISSYWLLRNRNVAFATRSFVVAAGFGLASALSVVVLGDESGYTTTEHQKMKLAAMESEWETQEPPASFLLFGIPDQEAHTNRYAVYVPWVLGLIATRSLDEPVYGIEDLVERAKGHIANGIRAYDAMKALRAGTADADARQVLADNDEWMGYALLLTRYVDDPRQATPAQIERAAWDTVPEILPIFLAFRVMVACGLFFIVLFAVAFYLTARRRVTRYPWFLKIAMFSLPLPWLSAELGWIVAEYGRQPWVIEGVLPTFLGVSDLAVSEVVLSLFVFFVYYAVLTSIWAWLMVRYVRLGPDGYFDEPIERPVAAVPMGMGPTGGPALPDPASARHSDLGD